MLTALVVGGDEARRPLQCALAEHGARVSVASYGAVACAGYARRLPDLVVILDDAGPADALALTRRLRALPEGERPLILIGGEEWSPGLVQAALEAGADDLLPLAVERLAPRLRAALHRAEHLAAGREAAALFEAAMSSAAVAHFIVQGGRFAFVNERFGRDTGYPAHELIGRAPLDFVHAGDRAAVRRAARAMLAGRRREPYEYRLLTRDGYGWARESVTLVRCGGRPAALGSVVAIGEEKRLAEALAEQALLDPLTDLPNRRLLMDRLGHAIAQGGRRGGALAVMHLDLDGFAAVNERRGRAAGDQVLAGVAGRLVACVRGGDTVARLDGDRFVILAEGMVYPADTVRIAERIVDAMRWPFLIGGEKILITASMGLSYASPSCAHADELLREAESALQEAKANGKGQAVVYRPSTPA